MTIEAVIFDWAGTTVDYGCFAPVQAFVEAFATKEIAVTLEEVRAPMGLLKRTHIETMLAMPRISETFSARQGRPWDDSDVEDLLAVFSQKLMAELGTHTALKPYVLEAVGDLRAKGIKIGSTTGYTRHMLTPVTEAAKLLGYEPDSAYTPDDVAGMGRPYPFMIFENMKTLQVNSVKNVIKIGDTVADIQEAKQAGVYAFGVIEGSSIMGLSKAEYDSLSPEAQKQKSKQVAEIFYDAGADVVLPNLASLKEFIS